ncbi:hypothetical protein SAMN05444392_101819 [Seinonella peptonophila]|uniref:Uncharacterized protein n=1 Tax=Seinonella peptonophila TaxID=112248 RepID=A0A1M4U586_9BACL|nr:hypothetical protein SAMN05444392_101819 [Seinonella peptonophila]
MLIRQSLFTSDLENSLALIKVDMISAICFAIMHEG